MSHVPLLYSFAGGQLALNQLVACSAVLLVLRCERWFWTWTQIPRKEPQASLDYWEVKGINSMCGINRWGLEMAGPQHDIATWCAPRNPSSGPETTVSSNGVTRWGEIGQGRFGRFA